MRGWNRRRRTARGRASAALGVLIAAALAAGCAGAGAQAETGPPVPSFATTEPSTPADPGAPTQGQVPDDCARLLTAADLGALLGMPLDSVTVRTTIGVPAPSVGRVERLDCVYSGTPGSPARGRTLLDVNAAAYSDPAAAEKQWRLNADAEDGDHREVPLGAASAVLVERRGEALLTVVHGTGTITLLLPERPLPSDRSPADVLVDLALRVLPGISVVGAVPTRTEQAPGTAS